MERKFPKINTIKGWKRDYDWLEVADRTLKCRLCTKWKGGITGCRNYNSAMIDGSRNFRSSVLKDHESTFMHKKACDLETKEKFGAIPKKHIVKDIPEHSAIKQAFKKMSDADRQKMKKLFEIAYYIGYNARPYTDFPGLIELEKLHGVELPSAYANETACKDFLHEISRALFDFNIKSKLKRAKFVSVLCDGTTDIATTEKEVIYVLFVDPDSFEPTLSYFALENLQDQSASGVMCAIDKAFRQADLSEKLERLVFLSSDGASTNSGMFNGLIAKLRERYPWVDFIWCVSHRLELALKDSLKDAIKIVEDPLRDLYTIYHRSSKKMRELRALYDILKEMYEFELGQVRPSKFCGTRWIDHKVRAMNGFIDKYGLYVHHIENVIADTSKTTDRDSLKGKLKRLQSAKVLLLSALFVDLLDRVKRLSLQSQKRSLTLLEMVECIDDTILHYELLLSKLEKHPGFITPKLKSLLDKIQEDSYQNVKLTNLNEAKAFISAHVCDYVRSIVECLRGRYGILTTNPWATADEKQAIIESVTAAMRAGDITARFICTVLDTGTWVLPDSPEDGASSSTDTTDERAAISVLSNVLARHLEAIDALFEHYKPVLSAPTSDVLKEQYISVARYATAHAECQAYSQLQMWKILHQSKAESYPLIFELVELCMCCPFSNAELERFFSRMANVKTDIRNRLTQDNLQDLCRVLLGPPLETFSSLIAAKAVDMWYSVKGRRTTQSNRKKYKKRVTKRMRLQQTSTDMELSIDDIFDKSSSSDESTPVTTDSDE